VEEPEMPYNSSLYEGLNAGVKRERLGNPTKEPCPHEGWILAASV
jgi:hypothetical protein